MRYITGTIIEENNFSAGPFHFLAFYFSIL